MVIWIIGSLILVMSLLILIFGFIFKKKKRYVWIGLGTGLVILAAGVFIKYPDVLQSGSRLSFETIGRDPTGTIVYLTLASTDQVTDEELGDRLRIDWQDKMVQAGDYTRISVVVFDDKAAAEKMLEIARQGLLLENLKQEAAQINPHIIASYHRDTAKGFHASYFYARDARMTLTNKIEYSNAK